MNKLKFSYFQLTFGQEEAYLHPEKTYQRLKNCGYNAIEICPPKGRYGLGVPTRYIRRVETCWSGCAVSCGNIEFHPTQDCRHEFDNYGKPFPVPFS